MDNKSARYCGRDFTRSELDGIRNLIGSRPDASRAALSRYVCKFLGWYRPNGDLKEMSCRVAMLRMNEDGLIKLPPPRNSNNNGKPYLFKSGEIDANPAPIEVPATAFPVLRILVVKRKRQSTLWNEYIQRFHYLGYAPVPGDQIRYQVQLGERVLALLSFRAAVWKTAPRDHFIGWNTRQKKKNIHLIVNNARFLILPWVHSPNLASRVLSVISKRIAKDWRQRYGYAPVLMETFVETPRFQGTCYKAANWIYLGETKGIGRLGDEKNPKLPIKTIWVYPLVKNFSLQLRS